MNDKHKMIISSYRTNKMNPSHKQRCAFLGLCLIVISVTIASAYLRVVTYPIYTDDTDSPIPKIKDVPKEYWEKLSQKTIFFAHQSIGDEIIEGLKETVKEHEFISLNIVELTDQYVFDKPALVHTRLGQCRYPQSKIEGFRDILDNRIGSSVDIAFMKFCYMDVTFESDAEVLFLQYCQTIEGLKNRFPNIKFLHVSVPIGSKVRKKRTILRESAKMLIGRPSALDDNLRRMQYNRLLTNSYSGSGLFDFALIESLNSKNRKTFTTVMGTEGVAVKACEYSDYDRGFAHLNLMGSKKTAEQLLITLANLANTQ